mmetsp:Transcript_131949/g.320673  ORF Transcript_131949/g.320673 Transcript_131949/m.320673 type:complete len:229 (+) Transcript_131949:131-817(+)
MAKAVCPFSFCMSVKPKPTNTFAVSALFATAAHMSAVAPSESALDGSAFFPSSSSATSVAPPWAANINGVLLLAGSAALASAPCSSSTWHVSRLPLNAAIIRALTPSSSTVWPLMPDSTPFLTMATSPSLAACKKGEMTSWSNRTIHRSRPGASTLVASSAGTRIATQKSEVPFFTAASASLLPKLSAIAALEGNSFGSFFVAGSIGGRPPDSNDLIPSSEEYAKTMT